MVHYLTTKTIITQGVFKNIKPESRSPILTEALQHILLQAAIDDDREQVKNILNYHSDLLLLDPRIKPIESQYTWQRFIPESPLMIALKRNQVEMIKIMLPYLQQLDQCDVMQQWSKAEAGIKQQNKLTLFLF